MPRKYTTEFFIKQSIKKFGKFLDYSLVEYKNSITLITLKCPIHGLFETTQNRHFNGSHPCNKCSQKIYTVDTFIENANKKHNYKYTYNINSLNSSIDIIKILCPNHGEFSQIARNHLFGAG